MPRITTTLLAAAFVLTALGWFALSTVLMDEVPKQWLVTSAAVSSFAIVAASGAGIRVSIQSYSRARMLLTGIAGILMIFVAPGLVLLNRFSDAPPGSEVLFFTTAVWALLGVAGALLFGHRRIALRATVFSLAGLLGSASILANWERPSSFSPLIRYPSQETAFMLAGVAWVAGTLLLAFLMRGGRERGTLLVATATGAAVSLIVTAWTTDVAGYTEVWRSLGTLFVAGFAFGSMLAIWARLLTMMGTLRPNALWFLVPPAMTAFAVFEQVAAPRGPDPVVWPGALAGTLVVVVGFVGLWLLDTDQAPRSALSSESTPLEKAAVWLSFAALAFGFVSLVLPAFSASVQGTLASGQEYEASWTMAGFESAGGWAPLVAGGLLFCGVTVVFSAERKRAFFTAASSVLVAAAYPLLASTPLHTWNRWVPVEIQTEYGTEYALLSMTAVHHPVRIGAVAAAIAGGALLLLHVANQRKHDRTQAGTASEVAG